MAAPAVARVRLPDDSFNGGKYMELQSEVDSGGFTVHTHKVVVRSRRKVVGVYPFVLPTQSVVAAAQNGTATGSLWMSMPAAGTTRFRLRKLKVVFSNTGEIDMLTTPRIVLARFTFTGLPAGVQQLPSVRKVLAPTNDVADANPQSQMYSTSVTWAVTLLATAQFNALFWSTLVPEFSLVTSGEAWAAGVRDEFAPTDEEEYMDIGPSEGIVVYQPDAGTAADTRRFSLSGVIDEYDNA